MTLTLELTPEQEKALQRKASLAGLDVATYAVARQLTDTELGTADDEESLYDSLMTLGVIGIVEGTPGPGDGRAWSHIEAACDPL